MRGLTASQLDAAPLPAGRQLRRQTQLVARDADAENVLEQRDAELQIHAGSGLDHEVNLGSGVTLERVTVGRAWAGHTLIQLDLRGRVNVQVLEWRRGDQLLAIDPKAPLREGDVLALAGSRDNLLAARWLE